MSQTQDVSYKELQKEAKKAGIPANMKREFLQSALEAYAENDVEKLNSILQYHKNNRKRRANKPLVDAEVEKSKTKKKNDSAAVTLHYTPERDERDHIDLTDDDDNPDNFHPDSTSTPNHHSFLNRFPPDSRNSPNTNAFSSLNNIYIPPYESRNVDMTSYFPSVPALLPRNRPHQESFIGDKAVCSSFYDTSVYKTPFLHQTQSQLCLYDNSNYNIVRENYYPSQSSSSLSSRYYESNTTLPFPEIGYERHLMICPSTAIENECSSKYLPNVPQLSDVRERTPTPSSLWPQNLTVANNARSTQYSSSINVNPENLVRAEIVERFDNRVTDTGSISAEFDSNSDTDSLSLPDDVASFFDAEIDNEERNPAHSLDVPNLYPRPNATSEILKFDDPCNGFPLNCIQHGTSGEDNDRVDGERGQDSVIGSLVPFQRGQPSNDLSLDSNNLLPSVTTLFPDFNMQAYYQAYMKLTKTHCDLNFGLDNSSNQFLQLSEKPCNTSFLDDLQNDTDETQLTKTVESSNCAKDFSIPFLTSNSNQSNGSTLHTLMGSKSTVSLNDEYVSENSSVTSSTIENITVVPMNVVNQAIEEVYEINGDPRKSTTAKFSSNGDGTRVVYTHESISVNGTIGDKSVKKDVCRKLFEIKMNKPATSVAMTTSEITTQNGSIESSVSSFRSCKNNMYGCVDIFKSNEAYAAVHEKECLYQVVHCPLDRCDWCDIMKTLTSHIYECHKADLKIGDEVVYIINRTEKDVPFVTYFQLHEGIIFVITLHITERKCITTMQYLPEIETTDYKNKRIRGVMDLIYFTSKAESKRWKGVVRPYFENDETLFQKGNTLQSTIANSKNIILRVLIK